MPSNKKNALHLNNGLWMPQVGLGCWQSTTNEVGLAVEEALRCGYRHIDTAYNYQNEESIGSGIKSWMYSGGKREDIFVVTKLPGIGMRAGDIEKFLKKSLASLGLSYVDLYLVHSPMGFTGKNDDDVFPFTAEGKMAIDPSTDLIAIWKTMEKMVDMGLTKSIGVSNFNIRQLTKLLAVARIPPAVHQVELHVYNQQKQLVAFCKKENIVITAYAPLGSPGRAPISIAKGSKVPKLLEDPVVTLVANNHKVTTAQVLIRFLVQSGLTVIPKSVNPERIKINLDVFGFSLSDVEIAALESLDMGDKGRSFAMMTYPGVSDHPECPV